MMNIWHEPEGDHAAPNYNDIRAKECHYQKETLKPKVDTDVIQEKASPIDVKPKNALTSANLDMPSALDTKD